MLTYERKIKSSSGEAVVVILEDGSIELQGYDPEQEDMLAFMTGQESACHSLGKLLEQTHERPVQVYALEWVVDDIRGAWSLAADSLEAAFWAYAKRFYEPWKQQFEETNPGVILQSVATVRKLVDVRTRFFPSTWLQEEIRAGLPSQDELFQLQDRASDTQVQLERGAFAGPSPSETRVLDDLYGAVARLYKAILYNGGLSTNFSYSLSLRERREEWFESAVRDSTASIHSSCWARALLGPAREETPRYKQYVDEIFGRFVVGMHELDNYRPWPELKNHGC